MTHFLGDERDGVPGVIGKERFRQRHGHSGEKAHFEALRSQAGFEHGQEMRREIAGVRKSKHDQASERRQLEQALARLLGVVVVHRVGQARLAAAPPHVKRVEDVTWRQGFVCWIAAIQVIDVRPAAMLPHPAILQAAKRVCDEG